MNVPTFIRATGVVLGLACVTSPAMARGDETPPDSICTVLGTAARYVGTTVTVRGVATSEGKVTTLADAQCKSGVALSIDEGNSHKRDVSSFRRVISGKNARADATVFGRFKSTGDATAPYVIDVYSVRDVVEVPADGT
ncbi:hypothetical protein FIV34_07365 [Luteibacter pinisoli]|jgi:hypothetical protein|uniref:DUF5666 domain-containing protein n=1 Tax=Luteibacter pinisoli TaxID=2589080 RepID=A0A4Y5Z360_9GAMM|nr:hypothetical protein [Luteibacter pinisoli]QDE39029.1 hypothetical protein FIV34_07365 [Luteibacter pinisoli]